MTELTDLALFGLFGLWTIALYLIHIVKKERNQSTLIHSGYQAFDNRINQVVSDCNEKIKTVNETVTSLDQSLTGLIDLLRRQAAEGSKHPDEESVSEDGSVSDAESELIDVPVSLASPKSIGDVTKKPRKDLRFGELSDSSDDDSGDSDDDTDSEDDTDSDDDSEAEESEADEVPLKKLKVQNNTKKAEVSPDVLTGTDKTITTIMGMLSNLKNIKFENSANMSNFVASGIANVEQTINALMQTNNEQSSKKNDFQDEITKAIGQIDAEIDSLTHKTKTQ